MSKLKAPLLSFGARGQLAKAIVFFPWKGLDCVREYVVPANPRTANQVTQRGHVTAGVTEWHAAAYSALDVIAWNRLAGIAEKIMSGFNRMIQAFVAERILGNTWTRLHDASTYGVGANGFGVQVTKASGGDAPTCHYGTRKTHFPDSAVMADAGGDVWAVDLAGLTASTLYYFTIDIGASADDWARTGIYQQRTTP